MLSQLPVSTGGDFPRIFTDERYERTPSFVVFLDDPISLFDDPELLHLPGSDRDNEDSGVGKLFDEADRHIR